MVCSGVGICSASDVSPWPFMTLGSLNRVDSVSHAAAGLEGYHDGQDINSMVSGCPQCFAVRLHLSLRGSLHAAYVIL